MRVWIGIFCAFFSGRAALADPMPTTFSFSAQSVLWDCKNEPEGVVACIREEFPLEPKVLLSLNHCTEGNSAYRICFGDWQASQGKEGAKVEARVSVRETILYSSKGGPKRSYLINGSVRLEGGEWRYVHITTSQPFLQDRTVWEGAQQNKNESEFLYPQFQLGPAQP